MDGLKRILNIFAPKAEKEDGRDVWGSRTAFVLAAMGGAVGLGNILRYPSVVFPNNGLQWFLPYFIALIFLAMPILMLEICIGQAARGGGVVAFHRINKRAKGVGLGTIATGYMVATYYVPILSWTMKYFRHSFTDPLPWTGRGEEFYLGTVIANQDPIPGNYSTNGNTVVDYAQYPGTGIIGETAGWAAFVWFVVFLCIFRGVGLTGRVVYITMGLPIVIIIILLGRSVSLNNAVDGIRMYMGHWDSSKLASGAIWQAAAGQIFFSTGVGFGYFTAFASYNTKFSNAVQDAVIIAVSNSLFEIIAAFAVFGVIGFLGLQPEDVQLSTFTVGFLTYPSAIVEMPGANFWAVLFFITLMLVGISSAFALVESLVTLLADSAVGRKVPRTAICTVVVVVSFLLSLIYCTEFGLYILDAVDTWLNNLSLLFIAWSECVASTTMYRCTDVLGQVGTPSFIVYNAGYFGGTIFGIAVGHAVSPEAGAGVGFGLYVAGTIVAILLARTPDSSAPRFWGSNVWMNRFWWLAFYSGHQLQRDLNLVVVTGKNWRIPIYWGPVVRYISAPILAIIVSFAYPAFYKLRSDPLHIFGFTIAHIIFVIVILGLVVPRLFEPILPPACRREPEPITIPNISMPLVAAETGPGSETEYHLEEGKEKEGVVGTV
ncbi:conserved hypothetical protein [Aspergillus terreus NIH2624]|uniref:Creatine transporter n=1 Tax=Aspergillus terreus (strain NIH 2624 / FGSC A1156) TaxID=341663 RepID=Q0CRP3_ASPTN|nr:uncharacterized protein ATEG_03641 [Aspergillus terreus NIH2624]EAU35443.1 conserved hypothetical protein [Aspergillus terreus NIH2624]